MRLIYLPSAALPQSGSAIVDDFMLDNTNPGNTILRLARLRVSWQPRRGRVVHASASRLARRRGKTESAGRAGRRGERLMVGFLFRAALSMVGLWIATRWVSGITIDDPQTLVLAGIVLGVVNAIVRPIAVILTFPLTLLTLGFFLLVVNAGMLGLTAWILHGFHVAVSAPRCWRASSSA